MNSTRPPISRQATPSCSWFKRLALAMALSLIAALGMSPVYANPVLQQGKPVSAALFSYGQGEGWKVEWGLGEDYLVDQEMSLPCTNVVANVQWVLRYYMGRGVLAGAGIDVDSEAQLVRVIRNGPAASRAGDPAVTLRMSSAEILQTSIAHPQEDAKRSTRTSVAPAPQHHEAKPADPVSVENEASRYINDILMGAMVFELPPEGVRFTEPTKVAAENNALALAPAHPTVLVTPPSSGASGKSKFTPDTAEVGVP